MADFDDELSTQQAATLSGFHPDHVRRLTRAGQIKARKFGNYWLIDRKSLEEYLSQAEERGQKRGPKPRSPD